MKRGLRKAVVLRSARRSDGVYEDFALSHEPDVRVRWASDEDETVLRELAGLEGAPVPARPVLIGEVEGHPCAALSLRNGQLVADPFRPAACVSELLRLRAAQIVAAAATRPTAVFR